MRPGLGHDMGLFGPIMYFLLKLPVVRSGWWGSWHLSVSRHGDHYVKNYGQSFAEAMGVESRAEGSYLCHV